jgi:cytochrome b561
MTPVTKTGLNPYVAGAHPAIEAGRYTLTAQALHWLTVFLILMILPVAWVMMSLPTGPEQTRMLVLHRSLGVTIFAVAVIRLAWRSAHPAPPLPSGIPRVMELISQITHWLLYALLLFMPVTGYLQSADGRPVSYFWLFNLPALPQDRRWVMSPKFFICSGSGVYIRWSASTSAQPSGTWLYDAMDCSIA